jgi:hypothetical protein
MTTTRPPSAEPAERIREALARGLRRVLEGAHPWGRYEASSSRSGATHFRLTVFPPGTNPAERRALARARDWPLIGAIAGLLAIAAFGDEQHPLLVTVVALALYAAGVVVTRSATRALRPRIRTLDAVRVFDGVAMTTRGDLRRLRRAAVALSCLDRDAAAGRIDEVEYEARWAAVYEWVAADASA